MGRELRREVETPQRHNTGLGLMLIASATMFFAVAGSAFLLRARMAHSHCRAPADPPVVRVRVAEPPVSTPTQKQTPCGQAVFQNEPDGRVSVYFGLCDSADKTE